METPTNVTSVLALLYITLTEIWFNSTQSADNSSHTKKFKKCTSKNIQLLLKEKSLLQEAQTAKIFSRTSVFSYNQLLLPVFQLCLSVWMYVCLPNVPDCCFSVCLFACLCFLFKCLFVCMLVYLPICLSVSLSVHLPFCLSVCLSVCQYVYLIIRHNSCQPIKISHEKVIH